MLNSSDLLVTGAENQHDQRRARRIRGKSEVSADATLVLNAGVKTLDGTITGAGTLVIGGDVRRHAQHHQPRRGQALTMGGGGGK